MGRLAVEGNREIYYERHNEGGRLAIVLVHGWGMSTRLWDYTVPALTDAGYEVLAADGRGCGRSDGDFQDVSVEAMGDDVVALVEHCGLDAVVLNGWSHGGAVAVDAAAKLAGRLKALVLTGGATPRYLQGEGWPYGGTEEVFAQTIAALNSDRIGFFHGLSQAVCHKDVGQPVVEWMERIFTETSHRADPALASLGDLDQRELVTSLDAPTLILHGREDGFVPFDATAAQVELFPKARLVEFDCGHAPFIEEREKYQESLLEFLGQLS